MMQRKSERILNLLQDDDALKQARLKAQRLSTEIHGFGSSPPAPAPSPPSSSSSSSASSSWSNSTTSSSFSDDTEDPNKDVDDTYGPDLAAFSPRVSRADERPSPPSWSHCYNRKEKESLLVNVEDEEEEEEGDKEDANFFLSRLCSRLGISPRGHQFRNHSFKRLDDGKDKRMLLRQFSRR